MGAVYTDASSLITKYVNTRFNKYYLSAAGDDEGDSAHLPVIVFSSEILQA